MIKVEEIKVYNIDGATRGLRNPYSSHDKSDSSYQYAHPFSDEQEFVIGEKDMELMQKLFKAGTEHRKFMRQIFVCMDITAPIYWWKQMDRYCVGVTTNSCSTMHTLAKNPITIEDFSIDTDVLLPDDVLGDPRFCSGDLAVMIIEELERLRQLYVKTKDAAMWRVLVQLLPEGYNQMRTVTMNYEVAATIIKQRKHHKLKEWDEFIDLLLKSLPYLADFMGGENG